jgi:hypothetical protein
MSKLGGIISVHRFNERELHETLNRLRLLEGNIKRALDNFPIVVKFCGYQFTFRYANDVDVLIDIY